MAEKKSAGELQKLVEAFEGMAKSKSSVVDGNPNHPEIKITDFVAACRVATPIISSFGSVADLANREFNRQLENVEKRLSNRDDTIQSVVEREISQDVAQKDSSSCSRSIVRARRAIEMVKIFFQTLLHNHNNNNNSFGGDSVADPLIKAYEQTFGKFHLPTVKGLVANYLLENAPSKSKLWTSLGEDDNSANNLMRNFVEASTVVIQTIDEIYLSSDVGYEMLKVLI